MRQRTISKKILEQDPDNDYAQNELTYIAQLRRRSQHSSTGNADDRNHTDNPSNTTNNDNTDSGDSANDK